MFWFDHDRTMKDGPNITTIASLIGDPARSNMLLSLMDGRALTASELAAASNITKQTASSHLSQMLHGGLVSKEVQGRHHYYRLYGPEIANAIEALLIVAENGTGKRTRTGPNDPALRKSRICYDHLAGELGVYMYDQMKSKKWISLDQPNPTFTPKGWTGLSQIGIFADALPQTRRPQCKNCLDWSARTHHLAGQIGAVILSHILESDWAKRIPDTRIIAFTNIGESEFKNWLK